LSTLRTGSLYAQEISHALISVTGLKDHVNKNSNDTIGNRTPDLPTCSAVPQPSAPPRAPVTITKSTVLLAAPNAYLACDGTAFR